MTHDAPVNKYRVAVQVLHRGRDVLVEELTDEILDHADDLADGGFAFNELLETQGTRLHFLSLLVAQLEQSADSFDEANTAPPEPPARKRRSRTKKMPQQATADEKADDR